MTSAREAIADIYGHYATAISVLTDEKFFQGISPSCPGTRPRPAAGALQGLHD